MPASMLAAAGIFALGGCASTADSAYERETRAQIRAMSERQAELERKVQRLESRVEVLSGISASRAEPTSGSGQEPGRLSTVKLGPQLGSEPGRAKSVGPDAKFDAAMGAMVRDPARSAETIHMLADLYPTHPRSPVALLAAGKALYETGDVNLATWTLQRVSDDYPLSPEAPEAIVQRALCELKLERRDDAKDLLTQVIDRYPQSSAASQARAELVNIEGGESASAAP